MFLTSSFLAQSSRQIRLDLNRSMRNCRTSPRSHTTCSHVSLIFALEPSQRFGRRFRRFFLVSLGLESISSRQQFFRLKWSEPHLRFPQESSLKSATFSNPHLDQAYDFTPHCRTSNCTTRFRKSALIPRECVSLSHMLYRTSCRFAHSREERIIGRQSKESREKIRSQISGGGMGYQYTRERSVLGTFDRFVRLCCRGYCVVFLTPRNNFSVRMKAYSTKFIVSLPNLNGVL